MDSHPPATRCTDNRFSKRSLEWHDNCGNWIEIKIGTYMFHCCTFSPWNSWVISLPSGDRFVMAMPREPTSSTPVVMEAPEISSKKSLQHHGSQEQSHWSMTSNTVVKQQLGAPGWIFDMYTLRSLKNSSNKKIFFHGSQGDMWMFSFSHCVGKLVPKLKNLVKIWDTRKSHDLRRAKVTKDLESLASLGSMICFFFSFRFPLFANGKQLWLVDFFLFL